MLKKIFLFCITFFFISSTFAVERSLDVNVSNTQVLLGENFVLEMSLEGEELPEIDSDIEVSGIENFDLFAYGQESDYVEINGQAVSRMLYSYQISPVGAGEYELGPFKITIGENEFISDDVFQITVLDSTLGNTPSGNITKESPEETQDSALGNTSLSEKGAIMGLRKSSFPWWGFLSVVILFFALFYLVLLEYLRISGKKAKKQSPKKQEKSVEKTERNSQIISFMQQLEKTAGEVESSEFFRRYNIALREIFEKKGVKKAKSATLKELKKHEMLENDSYFGLFKKSYKYEFSEKNISLETRKKYIAKLIELLK